MKKKIQLLKQEINLIQSPSLKSRKSIRGFKIEKENALQQINTLQSIEHSELEINRLELDILKHLRERLVLESLGNYILERMTEDGVNNNDDTKLNSMKQKLQVLSESNRISVDIYSKKKKSVKITGHEDDSGLFEYCAYINTKEKLSQRKIWTQHDNSTLVKIVEAERKILDQDKTLLQRNKNQIESPIDSTPRHYLVRSQTI